MELFVINEHYEEHLFITQLMKLSEKSFQEWDNEEDEIYDSF